MLPSASRAINWSASSLAWIRSASTILRSGDRRATDGAELVNLRARENGLGNLLELGGRHHEHHMGRRLFDRLQQRIERRGRQLMNLVDDEHLVAIAHREDAQAGDDHLADVVDLGVRGGVDLQDVHVAAVGDLHAGLADAARISGRSLDAVQRAGENPRGGRFADAARPGEHERLGEPAALERVAQRARHRLLSDHVVELLRPPFARDDLVGHRGRFQRLDFRFRFQIADADCGCRSRRCRFHRGPGSLRHMSVST
jgi:hypothetical protein